MRASMEKLKKKFVFVNAALASHMSTNDEDYHLSTRVKEVGNAVRGCTVGQLVFMPYNRNFHWMLVVLDLWKDCAMFFDPLNKQIPQDLVSLIKR